MQISFRQAINQNYSIEYKNYYKIKLNFMRSIYRNKFVNLQFYFLLWPLTGYYGSMYRHWSTSSNHTTLHL